MGSFFFVPNIVGYADSVQFYASGKPPKEISGAFKSIFSIDMGGHSGTEYRGYSVRLQFKANFSNSTFSNSTTVQPNSIRTLYIIKF